MGGIRKLSMGTIIMGISDDMKFLLVTACPAFLSLSQQCCHSYVGQWQSDGEGGL